MYLACLYDPNFTRKMSLRSRNVQAPLPIERQIGDSDAGNVVSVSRVAENKSDYTQYMPVVVPCLANKAIDESYILSASQVTAMFIVYVEKFHRYIPFHINLDIERCSIAALYCSGLFLRRSALLLRRLNLMSRQLFKHSRWCPK